MIPGENYYRKIWCSSTLSPSRDVKNKQQNTNWNRNLNRNVRYTDLVVTNKINERERQKYNKGIPLFVSSAGKPAPVIGI